MAAFVIVDDGWVHVTVSTVTGEVSVRVDVLQAHLKFAGLSANHGGEGDRAAAWVEWLETKGFPALSHGTALRLIASLAAELRALDACRDGEGAPQRRATL